MPFAPSPGSPREKIIVYGPAKTGKTSAHLSIAQMYLQTETPGTFWIIDTDDAIDRMLFGRDFPNIQVFKARKWQQYQESLDKILENVAEGDWIVVDFISTAYQAVQDWYLREYNKEERNEYFNRVQKELVSEGVAGKKSRMSLYREINWDVVKPELAAFMEPLIFEVPAHTFFTCDEKDIWKDGKPTDKTKPGGQPGLVHQVHSIIRLDKTANRRIINNVIWGDRERLDLNNESYSSFAIDYLCKAAGWAVR